MSILVNPNDKSRTGEASTLLFPKYHEFALVQKQEGCPAPTKDVALNLENRQKAISVANYGPMNPNEPNEEFWSQKAQIFGASPEEAKKSLCGNCAAFDKSPNTLNCIETGLGGSDSWDTVDAGELGYCKMFEFKCASSRTCDAWITGGPITENQDYVEKAESVRAGDMVSWNSSGGRAQGKVIRVFRDEKFKVPNSSFVITGTPEEPAAEIRLYRDGEPTETIVGHKVKTLTTLSKSQPSMNQVSQGGKPDKKKENYK